MNNKDNKNDIKWLLNIIESDRSSKSFSQDERNRFVNLLLNYNKRERESLKCN